MEPEREIRVLGRRKSYSGGLEGLRGFQEMFITLRGRQPFIPRGVYRFKSHEELREWTLRMLTRPRAVRPQ